MTPTTLTACCALACLAGTAQAQTTYDYSGAQLSGTQVGSFIGPDGEGGTFPYCCATLEGSMTLASPLAPNLNDAIVDPTALTFSLVGIYAGGSYPQGVIQSGGPLVYAGQYSPNPYGAGPDQDILLTYTTQVSTNSTGQITGWDFTLANGTGGPGGWQATVTSSGDTASYNESDHGPLYKLSSTVAGDWSVAGGGSAEAAPEINPDGAVPAVTMLLGLMAVIRGRRRIG